MAQCYIHRKRPVLFLLLLRAWYLEDVRPTRSHTQRQTQDWIVIWGGGTMGQSNRLAF